MNGLYQVPSPDSWHGRCLFLDPIQVGEDVCLAKLGNIDRNYYQRSWDTIVAMANMIIIEKTGDALVNLKAWDVNKESGQRYGITPRTKRLKPSSDRIQVPTVKSGCKMQNQWDILSSYDLLCITGL